MGTWGSGLYQDDESCDLRNSIKVLVKLPWPGDRLLSLLLETPYPQDAKEAAGSLFWLITADQFERKGIACRQASETAIQVITSKQDISNLRQRGMSEYDLKKRESELQKLLIRLKNPRPIRNTPTNPRQPVMVVKAGEIYTFPAMRGYMGYGSNIASGFNAWFSHWNEPSAHFSPDSWGAFIVLATGRAYDWLPWAACCSLSVPLEHKASMEEAVAACLIPGLEEIIPTYKPSALHLKRMQAQCIGSVPLDTAKTGILLPSRSVVNEQVAIGWSLCSAARNVIKPPDNPAALRLADLLNT